MYEKFYGLRERPFDLIPNPRFLLLTDAHREALGNLEYGISAHKGITVLTGEAGTGKTTLIRTALARADAAVVGPPASWAHLKNPRLSEPDFLEFLAARFGLSAGASESKLRLLDELEKRLAAGDRGALIVDEAQCVPLELLEEIRLLANIESDTEKLLPIILVGQPELADRLNEPALRQLKQRVALRCALAPLSLQETGAYIAGRITIAGGNPGQLFYREAVLTIHERSRGIPRTINMICDNALLTGYAEELRPVPVKVIETVCRDFDLPRWDGASAKPVPPDDGTAEVRSAPGTDASQPETSEARIHWPRLWGLRRR
jgi:type II secretory pathway predicted ATPase ExeA